MIPKKIHYCWFGGNPLPASAKKCIESWKKYLPDFEIKEWNEKNFDVNSHPYAKMAYEKRRWAYLSDVVRLIVVEREGGFYFDTDVELVRRPEELLDPAPTQLTTTQATITAWFGWETKEYINTGLGFAAEAHHPAVKAMLGMYENLTEIKGCPQLNTEALLACGLKTNGERQKVLESEILPRDWMCPYNDLTGVMKKTENTFSIHWFTKSPHGKMAYYRCKVTQVWHRMQEMLGIRNYGSR